jgi:hypothetical protein
VVKHFPVFGPKALAGIGKLPDTVTDRAIPVRMLKRKRAEQVEKFRHRTASEEAAPIATALMAALVAQPPSDRAHVPAELPDRAADAWEPLLAIADAAGGTWPARARAAAVVLHASRQQDDSLGLRLLSDVRLIFEARGVERIFTFDLIAALEGDEEGPWASVRFPLTPHRLSKLLLPFEIEPKQLRIGSSNQKGYEREAFVDAWERYLSTPQSPDDPKHRNTDHERRFDVSDPDPSDGGPADVPVEEDYPPSAWAADIDGDDADVDLWDSAPFATTTSGRSR